MEKLTQEQINQIVESHGKWMRNEDGGIRADFSGKSLDGASLNGANLDGASLNGASLNGASLDGASLYRASLNGANLNGANLDGASLYRASGIGRVVSIRGIGSRQGTTIYFIDKDNIRCGCWNNYQGGTLAEFEERVGSVYAEDSQYYKEYALAIDFFKEMQNK